MHAFQIPASIINRVTERTGKAHPFDLLVPARTALVVIDMQNYFMKPGFMGEVAMARAIVPSINELATGLRASGGHVVWIKNSTNDTRDSWSVFHDHLLTPELMRRRYETMSEDHEGHQLWSELDVRPQDAQIVKKRFSAFLPGSSDIDAYLKSLGIDTVLIAGTATNVCCESSARDAMMLNYKVVMISDATATFSDEEHQASLSCFYSLFGDVQTVDEALSFLSRDSQRSAA